MDKRAELDELRARRAAEEKVRRNNSQYHGCKRQGERFRYVSFPSHNWSGQSCKHIF